MRNFEQAAESINTRFSDYDNLSLFGSQTGLASVYLRDGVNCLEAIFVDDLTDTAWRRFGYILGQNLSVESLSISHCNINVMALSVGLQQNQHIRYFCWEEINLQDTAKIRSLAPFLSSNSSLRKITLQRCNIGPAGIDALSNALLNRTEDTLEEIDLSHNNVGDIDLGEFVRALTHCRNLRWLDLSNVGIGLKGCTSLSELLKNQASNLYSLRLNQNSINNDAVIVLINSLARNTKLERLNLAGVNRMVTTGWSSMLDLVCNNLSITDVMESNHTLHDVGVKGASLMKVAGPALGNDDANLLRASLEMIGFSRKMLVAKRKIIWSHARGNLNLGDSSIPSGAMPDILGWVGDANFIQYHHPPLEKGKIDIIRLDSMYRIVRDRPGICNHF